MKETNPTNGKDETLQGAHLLNGTACCTLSNENYRSRQTSVDEYYQKHEQLPTPKVVHAIVPSKNLKKRNKKIFVIGDVHGCYYEMLQLVAKAEQEERQRMIHDNDTNNNNNARSISKAVTTTSNQEEENAIFDYIILVGDICNKGPESAKVIRHVRTHADKGWLAVRGNHDDKALGAALGDPIARAKKKYAWVLAGEQQQQQQQQQLPPQQLDHANNNSATNRNGTVCVSDDDVLWLSELPYSITIPSSYFERDNSNSSSNNEQQDRTNHADTIVVHAGLVPGLDLESQSLHTMTHIRECSSTTTEPSTSTTPTNEASSTTPKIYDDAATSTDSNVKSSRKNDSSLPSSRHAWASQWNGPQRIIFGHDARRGLQLYPSSSAKVSMDDTNATSSTKVNQLFAGDSWAIGVDTGAVYGKQLTGIILPEGRIVSLDMPTVYCPIGT